MSKEKMYDVTVTLGFITRATSLEEAKERMELMHDEVNPSALTGKHIQKIEVSKRTMPNLVKEWRKAQRKK